MSTFGENIRTMRNELRLKQSELAQDVARTQKINVTQRQVSYWETGLQEPDIKTMIALARFFRISIDELVGNENF